MPRDVQALLPLKPLVFQILLALAGRERHGWSLVRELQARGGPRVLPGNLYRMLNAMLAEGLIDEVDAPRRQPAPLPSGGTAPRRFFRLTPLGREAAKAEARRLEALVAESRERRLLAATRAKS